jgi:polyisoprenoid-binding protein YceI
MADLERRRLDPTSAECTVFTFREGLLAALGHDLKIAVTRFSIEHEPGGGLVEATFDTSSLRVLCARKGDRDLPGSLSRADVDTIERQIREDVLHADRFPTATFRGRAEPAPLPAAPGSYDVEGTLSLHGIERPLRIVLAPGAGAGAGALEGEVSLFQPDFGITPYRGAMGALRVRPEVVVRLVRLGG